MNRKPHNARGKKSRVISIRLNPVDEYEAKALAYLDDLIAQEYTPREIITDALLKRAGKKPEMFRREKTINTLLARLDTYTEYMPDISQKLDAILDMIETRIDDMLRNIRDADPAGFRDFASEEDQDALSEEFIHNAKIAVRNTFRGRDSGTGPR